MIPVWKQWLRTVGDYDIELAADPGFRKLSRYERNTLDEVFDRYIAQDHWEIIDELHQSLPEWKKNFRAWSTSTPISAEDLLTAVGREKDIPDILADANAHLGSTSA